MISLGLDRVHIHTYKPTHTRSRIINNSNRSSCRLVEVERCKCGEQRQHEIDRFYCIHDRECTKGFPTGEACDGCDGPVLTSAEWTRVMSVQRRILPELFASSTWVTASCNFNTVAQMSSTCGTFMLNPRKP